jgi:Vanillate O-demethylase oxygenase C-terminal domain
LRVGLGVVLEEDAEALRLQQSRLNTRPPDEHDILIAHDAGIVKARRIMAQLLAAEAKAPGL